MIVGKPKFHSWGRCTMALTKMHSDLRFNLSSWPVYYLYYVDPLFRILGLHVTCCSNYFGSWLRHWSVSHSDSDPGHRSSFHLRCAVLEKKKWKSSYWLPVSMATREHAQLLSFLISNWSAFDQMFHWPHTRELRDPRFWSRELSPPLLPRALDPLIPVS